MIHDHTKSKPLFKWLRKVVGIKKPKSAPIKRYSTGDETWDDWRTRVRTTQPFGYWLTETVPDFIDDIRYVYKNPIDDVHHYIANRFCSKTHYLKTGLKAGSYYEVNTRMLHGLFTTLVDFIEVEKASHSIRWDDEGRKKYKIKWYHNMAPFSWFVEWRNPEAGIEYLQWEMGLVNDENYLGPDSKDHPDYGTPTNQAISAKEQYDLYLWWTQVRPSRIDPYSITTDFYKRMDEKYPEQRDNLFKVYDEQDEIESRNLYKRVDELEEQYISEDDAMMIRLVKLGRSLWT